MASRQSSKRLQRGIPRRAWGPARPLRGSREASQGALWTVTPREVRHRATLVEILPGSGSKVEKLPFLTARATSAIASSSPPDRILPGGSSYQGWLMQTPSARRNSLRRCRRPSSLRYVSSSLGAQVRRARRSSREQAVQCNRAAVC